MPKSIPKKTNKERTTECWTSHTFRLTSFLPCCPLLSPSHRIPKLALLTFPSSPQLNLRLHHPQQADFSWPATEADAVLLKLIQSYPVFVLCSRAFHSTYTANSFWIVPRKGEKLSNSQAGIAWGLLSFSLFPVLNPLAPHGICTSFLGLFKC